MLYLFRFNFAFSLLLMIFNTFSYICWLWTYSFVKYLSSFLTYFSIKLLVTYWFVVLICSVYKIVWNYIEFTDQIRIINIFTTFIYYFILFYFIFNFFYSVTILCIFSPSLHPPQTVLPPSPIFSLPLDFVLVSFKLLLWSRLSLT